jgi:hypothetical protein
LAHVKKPFATATTSLAIFRSIWGAWLYFWKVLESFAKYKVVSTASLGRFPVLQGATKVLQSLKKFTHSCLGALPEILTEEPVGLMRRA